MSNIEIEKKIILKSIPDIEYDEILKITQYYLKVNGVWERYRKSESINTGEVSYIKTTKSSIDSSIAKLERERYITKEMYKEIKNICLDRSSESKKISKTRYIKYSDINIDEFGILKWEIDDFNDIKIIIAEIEIPYIDYKVVYPSYIKDVLIRDVTGMKEFNNRRMSFKI